MSVYIALLYEQCKSLPFTPQNQIISTGSLDWTDFRRIKNRNSIRYWIFFCFCFWPSPFFLRKKKNQWQCPQLHTGLSVPVSLWKWVAEILSFIVCILSSLSWHSIHFLQMSFLNVFLTSTMQPQLSGEKVRKGESCKMHEAPQKLPELNW